MLADIFPLLYEQLAFLFYKYSQVIVLSNRKIHPDSGWLTYLLISWIHFDAFMEKQIFWGAISFVCFSQRLMTTSGAIIHILILLFVYTILNYFSVFFLLKIFIYGISNVLMQEENDLGRRTHLADIIFVSK
jgi:hypothetical protein